jgi:spermidine/putrescine-binding protein
VVVIAGDDGQEWLARGDVDVTIEYSGDIFLIGYECECDSYAYSIPEEGTDLWTDTIGIPVDAPNPELANVFINYILDAQVGADLSNYTFYGSPNQAAIDAELLDPELLDFPGIYPPDEVLEKTFVIQGTTAEAEQLYNDAWDELLIFVGS